jgi:serine/threonine-protein kinase RsbW
MPPKPLRLEVANDFDALPAVAHAAWNFLAGWGAGEDDIADVLVILDEFASNLIRHAWPSGSVSRFQFELSAEPSANGILFRLYFEDDGVPFDPTRAVPGSPPDFEDDSRPPGGFGLHLAARLADRLHYQRVGGRNQLLVTKCVSQQTS